MFVYVYVSVLCVMSVAICPQTVFSAWSNCLPFSSVCLSEIAWVGLCCLYLVWLCVYVSILCVMAVAVSPQTVLSPCSVPSCYLFLLPIQLLLQ